jgi:hypothetical protein
MGGWSAGALGIGLRRHYGASRFQDFGASVALKFIATTGKSRLRVKDFFFR